MKKLGIFALLLSLSTFSFGCGEAKKEPVKPPVITPETKPEDKPAADAGTENAVEDGAGGEAPKTGG